MKPPIDILLEEAAHLARATVAQTYLVRQEAELIEAALFEPQDDPLVHHVRPGQTSKPTGRSPMGNVEHAEFGGGIILDWSSGQRAVFDAEIIPFPQP
jgi:hypothetical protein